jgi:hypothetical protein
MNKKIIFLALFICLCFSSAIGQETPTDLKDKKITIKGKDKPLWAVFYRLMAAYDVPIGMEASTLDKGTSDFMFNPNLPYIGQEFSTRDGYYAVKNNLLTLEFENARLETVLDEIVRQMKNYKWEINDGVVNIVPTKGRDARYEKLLELRIGNFSFQKDFNVAQIRNDVLDLPEVQKFLSDNKIFSTKLRPYTGNVSRSLPIEMKFSDLTFRELLNKITKIKRGGWLLRDNYLYGSDEKEYIEIDI